MSRKDEQFARDLLSGVTPQRPVDDVGAIKETARGVWRERYGGRRSARLRWFLVPAAAALTAALVLTLREEPQPRTVEPRVPAAVVARVSGAAFRDGLPMRVGDRLLSGTTVEANVPIALRMRGHSVRLDAGTRALILRSLVELHHGGLYVDTGEGEKIIIRTTEGEFTPAGTQFEVRAGEAILLRVREGTVQYHNRSGTSITAVAGEELRIVRHQPVTRSRIRTHDPIWDWAAETAPLPQIEGRSLRTFLEWICREKGWKLEFAGETAALGDSVVLHGSVEHLRLLDALHSVMLSSGLSYEVRNGTLVIW